MRRPRGEAGPFDLSRCRRAASDPGGLVRLILYRGPISLVAGVHTSPKHARVYLRHQAVVLRPRFYPIRSTLRALHLPIDRNLHSSDQLPHANLPIVPSGRHAPVVFLLEAAPAVPEWLRLLACRAGDQNVEVHVPAGTDV